jgi:hypothetical protein
MDIWPIAGNILAQAIWVSLFPAAGIFFGVRAWLPRARAERKAATDKAHACVALEAARWHFAAALNEFQRAGASYYVAGTQENIRCLDAAITRLCG